MKMPRKRYKKLNRINPHTQKFTSNYIIIKSLKTNDIEIEIKLCTEKQN